MTSEQGRFASVKAASATPYFPSLDGLRALSVFLVITAHTRGPASLLDFFPGWLGVDIFFALSGFLIMTLLLREKRLTGRVDLPAFYIRRAFRILPVYLVLLGVYTVLSYHRGGAAWANFKPGLPFYLGFLNEFSPASTFSFTWTLGIEEKFYMVWPALSFILFVRSRRLLTGIVYIFLVLLMPFTYQNSRSYSGLILGCALALALDGPKVDLVQRSVAALPVIVPFCLLLAAGYLCFLNVHFVLLFSPAILFLIAHLNLRRSWLKTLLSGQILTWIGRRSYSMYLVHGLILGAIEEHVTARSVHQRLAIACAATCGAALVAHLLYLTIEEPSRKVGKKITVWRRQRQVVTLPGASI